MVPCGGLIRTRLWCTNHESPKTCTSCQGNVTAGCLCRKDRLIEDHGGLTFGRIYLFFFIEERPYPTIGFFSFFSIFLLLGRPSSFAFWTLTACLPTQQKDGKMGEERWGQKREAKEGRRRMTGRRYQLLGDQTDRHSTLTIKPTAVHNPSRLAANVQRHKETRAAKDQE